MEKRLGDLLKKYLPKDSTPGSLVRAFRKNFEFTLKEMEELTGIKESNLSALENDKMEMTKHYAELLGAALGVHPSTILFPNGYQNKSKELLAIERKAAALKEKKMR